MNRMRKVALFLIVIAVASLTLACSSIEKVSDTPEQIPETDEEEINLDLDYEIIEKQDVSYFKTIRYLYRIAVPKGTTQNEIKAITESITNNIKRNEKVNAVSLAFYTQGDYYYGPPTVADVCWAPYGEWDKADEMSSGNYTNFDFKYTFKDVEERDANVTDEEREIYTKFMTMLDSKANPSYTPMPDNLSDEEAKAWLDKKSEEGLEYEKNCCKKLSKEYNKTVEEIDEIITKVGSYLF